MYIKKLFVPLLVLIMASAGACGDDSSESGENINDNIDGGIIEEDGFIDSDADIDCLPTGAGCEDPSDCCSGVCQNNVCIGPEGPCLGIGEDCLASSDCCSGRCEETALGRVCVRGGCIVLGDPCVSAVDCCSMNCSGGLCSDDGLCSVIGSDCSEDEDCCSGICGIDGCEDPGSPCRPLGELCGGDSGCCSGACREIEGEYRCINLNYCRASGEICTTGADCCTGVCGEDGLCPSLGECATAGEPCTGYHECCSGVCSDPGTGVPVCLFVSGCRPRREVCLKDSDCCSDMCSPEGDTGVFRCEKQTEPGCQPTGELCWEGMARNCCPSGPGGGYELCLMTAIGVRRCFGEGVPDECIPDGDPCSFSDECCSGYCLPNEEGDLVCGGDCVPVDGECLSDMDCCDGLICINGICEPHFSDCIVLGDPCQNDEDCCSNFCNPDLGICQMEMDG